MDSRRVYRARPFGRASVQPLGGESESMGMSATARGKSIPSRWMTWKPRTRILTDSSEGAPSEPTKPGFDGFVGSPSAEPPEIAAKSHQLRTPTDILDDGVTARLHVFRRQFEATAAPGVPAFLFRPDVAQQQRDADKDDGDPK